MTNEEFAARWRDVWTVFRAQAVADLGGLEHVTAKMDDQGGVVLNSRLDIAQGDSVREGRPDVAEARVWLENRIVLRDAGAFVWSSYRSREGATPTAVETLGDWARNYASDVRFEPLGAGEGSPESESPAKLRVFAADAEPMEIEAAGGGPIVPEVLIGAYATTRPLAKPGRWPVRFLSFERDRQSSGRRFFTWRSHVRYAGRKGPQTGLSHTFESEPMEDGRVFSTWVGDSGRLIGIGDEREVFLAAPDEEAARAFLRAGPVRS